MAPLPPALELQDRYTEGNITDEYVSDYDPLVITKAVKKRKDHEITGQSKTCLCFRAPVNVVTHDG